MHSYDNIRPRKPAFSSIYDALCAANSVPIPPSLISTKSAIYYNREYSNSVREWVDSVMLLSGGSTHMVLPEERVFVDCLISRLNDLNKLINSPECVSLVIPRSMWSALVMLNVSNDALREEIDALLAFKSEISISDILFPEIHESHSTWKRDALHHIVGKERSKLFSDIHRDTGIHPSNWVKWIASNVPCSRDIFVMENKLSEVKKFAASISIDGKIPTDLVLAAFPELDSITSYSNIFNNPNENLYGYAGY